MDGQVVVAESVRIATDIETDLAIRDHRQSGRRVDADAMNRKVVTHAVTDGMTRISERERIARPRSTSATVEIVERRPNRVMPIERPQLIVPSKCTSRHVESVQVSRGTWKYATRIDHAPVTSIFDWFT